MKTLLIIDDDEEFSSELGDILTDEGYNINIANDGEKAINLINNFIFDLILLDYKMPVKNGIEFIKYIKEKNIETKLILISGSMNIEKLLEQSGVLSDVSFVLNKPFIIEDLLNKIESLQEGNN
jgi:CheY-like chemotaxis protein